MGADTTAIKKIRKKFNEHDYHSMKTPVCGTYGLSAHPISMITTVGKYQIGNGDRWQNVRWTPTGFQPTDHDDDNLMTV